MKKYIYYYRENVNLEHLKKSLKIMYENRLRKIYVRIN